MNTTPPSYAAPAVSGKVPGGSSAVTHKWELNDSQDPEIKCLSLIVDKKVKPIKERTVYSEADILERVQKLKYLSDFHEQIDTLIFMENVFHENADNLSDAVLNATIETINTKSMQNVIEDHKDRWLAILGTAMTIQSLRSSS